MDDERPQTTGFSSHQDHFSAPKEFAKDGQPAMSQSSEPTSQPQDLQSMIFSKLGISNAGNPFICILHMLFKVIAITTYLFSSFFFNTVMIFLMVSIFTVLDFWVVKNISGRWAY
jgi:hypothetical protein